MYVLSIHTEGSFFKVAILFVKGKRIAIESLQEGLIEDFNLQKILQPFHNSEILMVSALTPDQVMIRIVSLPVKQIRQAKKVINYQLEDLFPFDVEEATIIRSYRKSSKGIEATLMGYQNTVLCQHLQEMKTLGVDPDYTFSIAQALRRFAQVFAEEKEPFVLLHFGWEESYLIFEKNNCVQKALSLPFGYRQVIDLLPEQAEEPLTRTVLEEAWHEGRRKKTPFYEQALAYEKKLRRVLEFFTQESADSTKIKIFYTGSDSIGRFLSRQLIAEEQRIQMIPHLQFRNEHLLDYAVAVGLCLDAIEQDQHSIQFRKGRFIAERTKKHTLRIYKQVAIAAISSSLLVFFCLQGVLHFQKNQMQKKALFLIEQVEERETTYSKLMELQSLVDVKKDLSRLLCKQKQLETDASNSFLVSECLQWLAQNSSSIVYFTKIDFAIQELEKTAKIQVAFVVSSREQALEFAKNLERTCPYTIEENPNLYPLERECEYGMSLVITQ